MSWRNKILTHPATEMFPVLSGDNLVQLEDDIREHGLRAPVTLLKPAQGAPQLLDGRSRLDAAERAGVSVLDAAGNLMIEHQFIEDGPEFDPVAFVVSMNLHRRHLTRKEKRGIIEALLRERPERSNRATAALAKASDHTVSAVRHQLEQRAQIANVDRRVDTRGRHQPASKQGKSARRKRRSKLWAEIDRQRKQRREAMKLLSIKLFGDPNGPRPRKDEEVLTLRWLKGENIHQSAFVWLPAYAHLFIDAKGRRVKGRWMFPRLRYKWLFAEYNEDEDLFRYETCGDRGDCRIEVLQRLLKLSQGSQLCNGSGLILHADPPRTEILDGYLFCMQMQKIEKPRFSKERQRKVNALIAKALSQRQ